MFEGPESDLTLTENAQPALMAASLAVIRVMEAENGFELGRDIVYVAGHSLGEYSALAAAGALLGRRGGAASRSFAARRCNWRCRSAKARWPRCSASTSTAARAIAAAAAQGEVCAVANDNAPGQIVVSGNREAVERAIAISARAGRAAGDQPAGQRAFSLAADGARRPGDGAGARPGGVAPAVGPARRQSFGRSQSASLSGSSAGSSGR